MSLGKSIKLFTLFNFLSNIKFYLPIQLIYFYHITNSYSLSAGIASVTMISSAILELPTGVFSDRIGRKKTITLGSLSIIAALFLYALGTQYWVLILGAIFYGASIAFYSGNNDAYLHDMLANENLEQEYHNHYGKINSGVSAALSISALLSGFIANESFRLLIWASIVPQILALIVSFYMKDIKLAEVRSSSLINHFKEAILEFKTNVNLRLLSLSSILGDGAGMTAYQFQSAVITSVWPLWAVGIARAFQEWSGIPGYYFAGKIINKFGAINIALFGSFQSWISNILAVIFQPFSPIFIASSAILWSPSDTAQSSLFQKEFTEKQRATMGSLNSLLSSTYFAIIAYLIGIFANSNGPFKALLLTQILFAPSLFLQFLLFKRLKKQNSHI